MYRASTISTDRRQVVRHVAGPDRQLVAGRPAEDRALPAEHLDQPLGVAALLGRLGGALQLGHRRFGVGVVPRLLRPVQPDVGQQVRLVHRVGVGGVEQRADAALVLPGQVDQQQPRADRGCAVGRVAQGGGGVAVRPPPRRRRVGVLGRAQPARGGHAGVVARRALGGERAQVGRACRGAAQPGGRGRVGERLASASSGADEAAAGAGPARPVATTWASRRGHAQLAVRASA
jgi:hypothetical protein